MRLQRVVLYQNGVGYFERNGTASGETLDLRLRAHEVDDVMKTLTVIGADGTAALSAAVPERPREPVRPGEDEEAEPEDYDASTTLSVQLGQESGPITVTYAVPTPSWGAVHRIVLPSEGDEALLQSWAVIHNASGEDWEDVELTLSTGAPFTYAIDLRTPRFLPRPDLTGSMVEPLAYGAVRSTESRDDSDSPPPPPPAPEPSPALGSMSGGYGAARREAGSPAGSTSGYAEEEMYADDAEAMPEPSPAPTVESMSRPAAARASVEDTTAATRYELAEAVTIPAGHSTLVAIVNERVPGRDILLFRPDGSVPASRTHPFHAARLVNDSGLSLIQGPVALYARGTFVGEGVLNRLAEGENTTIPYAVDMSTEIISTTRSEREIHRLVSIVDGVATLEEWATRSTRYEIRAGNRIPERAYITHHRIGGYELIDEPEGTEASGLNSLIPVEIEPGETTELVVTERRSRNTRRAILNLPTDVFVELAGSEVPPEVRQQFDAVVAIRRELGELESQLRDVREQRAVQSQRLSELQQSLSAIERSRNAGELRNQLQTHLREATQATEQFTVQEAELTAQIAELRVRLRESVRDLAFQPSN